MPCSFGLSAPSPEAQSCRLSAYGSWPGRARGGGTNYYTMDHPPPKKMLFAMAVLGFSKGTRATNLNSQVVVLRRRERSF